MSDDKKTPDLEKHDTPKQMDLGSLLSGSSVGPDDDDFPDDFMFEGADLQAEQDIAQNQGDTKDGTPESASSGSKPDLKVVSDNVIPLTKAEAEAGGELQEDAVEDETMQEQASSPLFRQAALFRHITAERPMLTGEHVHLVTVNEYGEVLPSSPMAAEELKALGGDVDIFITRPGETIARPLMMNAETKAIVPNAMKKARPVPKPEPFADGQFQLAKFGDEKAGSEKEGEKEKDTKVAQTEEEPRKKDMSMLEGVVNHTFGMIGGAFKALGAFLKWALSRLLDASTKLVDMVKDRAKMRMDKHNRSSRSPVLDKISVERSALHNINAQVAGQQIQERLKAAVTNVHDRADHVVSDYQSRDQQAIDGLTKGLGVHEVGAPVIESSEAFYERLESRNPDDQGKVQSALTDTQTNGQALFEGVQEVISHPDMSLIAPSDRAAVLAHMDSALGRQRELDGLSAAAVNHAIDHSGVSMADQRQQQVTAAQSDIRSALSRAQKQYSEGKERRSEMAESTMDDRETEQPRPGM